VSIALASIFSKILESGEVPKCPQFADAVMTALYKGVGDRDMPTNYRGICVPNVIAKLFGLVIGTRLSHWAVANGVISPAQTGFVAMHGCEYHIFTLLETLRHRVRQGKDSVVIFLDFKKAYDSVPQALLWDVLRKMGAPEDFVAILRSWTDQSNISLKMGGAKLEPFPQETGVPQGGVLSPICFNFFIEILLRYVNAHAAEFGVPISAVDAAKFGAPNLPAMLHLLALAYADDVVLICPNMAAAQSTLNLVQKWASAFGMAIGVGQGKTEAMLVRASIVTKACADDVNGMLKKSCAPHADGMDASSDDDPDDDSKSTNSDPNSVGSDEEWRDDVSDDDPTTEKLPQQQQPKLRKGQALVKGVLCGAGTGRPLPYEPRPLPPKPDLPPLQLPAVVENGPATPIPWTNLYKYLGYFIRSDLLDDHAYARVETKVKKAAERLFPHHRLVRAWPAGLKLQLLQTIVLSIAANVMPLMTSMRSPSESKTRRLDQLRKKIAQSILQLSGNPRHAYITSEACMGDVTGEITMHRLRLLHALRNHPLRGQASPPIACRVLDIMEREAEYWHRGVVKHNILLAPWPLITKRITESAVKKSNSAGWQPPHRWWEISPHASVVARLGERERWIDHMNEGLDWMSHSFALRPPSFGKQHTAALHSSQRLKCTDAGSIAKLVPLSCLGPHGSSITTLARRNSPFSRVLSNARQGNIAMQSFPFVTSDPSTRGKKKKPQKSPKRRRGKNGGMAAATDVTADAIESNRRKTGATCHLCTDSDDGPHYDLWHVLFECPTTRESSDMVAVRDMCKAFVPRLCDMLDDAVDKNSSSMSDTRNAGVLHSDITRAIAETRDAIAGYLWDSTPGRWLIYRILLAMPFPAASVRPDPHKPIWQRPFTSRRRKAMDLSEMPVLMPVIAEAEYRLPELVGRLFDVTILSRDVLRPMADAWCSMAQGCLLRAGKLIRPLRLAAELKRAASLHDAVDGVQAQDAEP
jgi:hypothetical protein